jgi:Zinc finger, C3HC4 type (RING finger)
MISDGRARNLADKFIKENQASMVFIGNKKTNKVHIQKEGYCEQVSEGDAISSVKLKECVVCMSGGPADAVIMPCGHSGICYECAIQMLEKDQMQCHLCREDIE